MKRKNLIKIAALGLSITLAATNGNLYVLADPVSGMPVAVYQEKGALPSPVLITELVPNTQLVGSLNGYEYFELTNVTDREIDLSNYNIVYINGTSRAVWETNVEKIPAGETMVVWIKNGDNNSLTKTDFLEYYGMQTDAFVAEVQCSGLANSGSRSMAIETKTGKELFRVTYKAADSEDKKLTAKEAVVFSYSGGEISTSYDNAPSPLSPSLVEGSFVSPEAVANPTVTASSADTIEPGEVLEISITQTNLDVKGIIKGYISVEGGNDYDLTYADGVLKGSIPYSSVREKESFQYTVTITDGVNKAVSQPKTVTVSQGSGDVDRTKAPELVITEIMPDTTNYNGSDGYEYIEIYNNTDKDIDLKDYRLSYLYPDNGTETLWWETEGRLLKAGDSLVFWVKNGANDSLTVEEFNTKFKVSLDDTNLIELSCDGMSNSGARGLKLSTNVGDVVDTVFYNENGTDDTTANKSIVFQNQFLDGNFISVLVNNQSTPTPGMAAGAEIPYYQAQVQEPSQAPVLKDSTPSSYSNDTESLTFSLDAQAQGGRIKSVKLCYRYQGEENFETYNLERAEGDHFEKTLLNVDLLNKKSYTYYFIVSDGFHTVTTEEKTIQNADASKINAPFNLSEGELVGGSTQVIVWGDTLFIDGQDMGEEIVRSINGDGKIVFDVIETDVFFKNAVSIGDSVLGVFNEGTYPYNEWKTYVYDVNAAYFDYETKTLTVQFHAGNKANVLEHNIENNDDFQIKNIRMVLPSGKTLYPSSYEAKKGLGEVEHDNMDGVEKQPLSVSSPEQAIKMGDGTSKNEIVYANFTLTEEDFEAVRYLWNTTETEDGSHQISNGTDTVAVTVDNTAPEISTNMEEGKDYHRGTITVEAKDEGSTSVDTVVVLDGKTIETPYEFRSLEMEAGSHTLSITATDEVGNQAVKEVTFTTPEESANIGSDISPENGSSVTKDPVLSITATDPSGDRMNVTFKQGQRYQLGDANISSDKGVSEASGTEGKDFSEDSGNGFPYECFTIDVSDNINENAYVDVTWKGTAGSEKTYLYVYNTVSGQWDKIEAEKAEDGGSITLKGTVSLKEHLLEGTVKVMVQAGEGYTPPQYEESAVSRAITTVNADDTPRENYDFTFVIESDTQYYNEDYDGNPDQIIDGSYQYQLDIHEWVLANRERMNIQYLFHDGDIIDDEPNTKEWEQADAAYKMLDEAGLPYGILAGNHDVGHLNGDYTKYYQYFGEARYEQNPWYGESYKNNRGHYDLITVDGIDFLMVYMGWGVGDEEIQWLNDVLSRYPERKAILNFHEYLLASGGLGEEPQRIYNEVVAVNDNVCMVLSGHYHNAYSRTDTFMKADGTERKVYSLLFDYQGLPEGGLGYMRLMHFDMEGEKIIFRTYSPSLDDYDAKTSASPNEGNDYVVTGADGTINGEETFEISFADLGIIPENKTLATESLDVNVYGEQVIGSVNNVESGTEAAVIWENAPEGTWGWYAEVTDENGGLSRTPVYYLTMVADVKAPELKVPDVNTIVAGEDFDPMEGVSAGDEKDGDLTDAIRVTGVVNTGKPGSYELTYEVSDRAGNTTVKKRVIVVTEGENQDPGTEEKPEEGNQNPNQGGTQEGDDEKGSENVVTGDTSRTGLLWGCGLASALLAIFGLRKRKEQTEEIN